MLTFGAITHTIGPEDGFGGCDCEMEDDDDNSSNEDTSMEVPANFAKVDVVVDEEKEWMEKRK